MPKGCNRGSDHTMDTKELVNYARWSIISEQTGYNIFHWLAYWNDTESLYYLLNNIDKNAKNFQLMQTAHFHTNDQIGNTPIDIAGENNNHESAIILAQHFSSAPKIVEEIFKKSGRNSN